MACIGEIAVGVASAILGKIGEYTVAPVGRQLGYLFRYTTNVSELRTQLEDLNNATQRMERRVNEALNNCHEIEADVQTWQKNAEQISGEATTFLNAETHAKALCSCGSPHHLVTRHQLSRKANKMSINVRELLSKNKEFDSKSISFPRRPEDSSATPTKGYESFYSRGEIMKSILAAVRDGNKRIGLHGMGGIGKTMLAKEIARLAQEEKLFSKVVMTTVSQTPNIKEIQQHIAEKLGLKLEEKDSTGKRAELLRMRLKQDESKILLILDDIWNELDLEAIGIQEECRMLITSRDQQVLRNFMGVAESNVFLIGALQSSEAIDLFKSIIGDIEADYIKDLALKIVHECGGLPIAIATVAHALKNKKEEAIWKDAFRRLESSNYVEKKVYSSIKLSYDFLGSQEEEAKLLLLLCALHKEDEEIHVEHLTRYSMGWRLLQDIETVEDARNRVNLLVVKLKSHCLLLDATKTDKVKMHDVIRDVCIHIAKEDHGHRMMKNIGMCEDESTKAFKAISFVDYDDFDNLPPELECPSLELLLLSSRSALESIPDEFFKQTGLLKVLIMNGTRQRSLPSSFASLQNLRTLCLRGSSLEDIAVIGQLTNLKALDLSRSSYIERLPKEIGALKRLQVLDLRKCTDLRVIEAKVISNLKEMEELYLPREFEGWDEIINEEGGIRNASLMEIKSLQQLTALSLCVPSEHVLPQGLFSEKLERYHISIGVEYFSFFSFDVVSNKWLSLCLSELDQVCARELISLMRRSECLSLTGSMSVNNVSPSLVNQGFPRLKYMRFHNNDGVQCIINSTDVAFLPRLESLILQQLRSLESICRGNKLPRGSFNELRTVVTSFPNLKVLYVSNCDNLKSLLSSAMARSLVQLEILSIYGCEKMEEVIVMSDHDKEYSSSSGGTNTKAIIPFQNLRCLELCSLPNFIRFCELGDYCIECPLLLELEIMDCPKLKELFMGVKRTSSSCTINTTDNNVIGEEMDRMVSAPNKQILFKHNNKKKICEAEREK
uniref:AAA+ ATPase domain-containing protein n=1 Tax=Cannabis sativa TaxID=3483 RepID=A0A803QAG5_CANSA